MSVLKSDTHPSTDAQGSVSESVAETGLRLRVYLDDAERAVDHAAYAAIVYLAHRSGISGAAVFHDSEGYGTARRLHTDRLVDDADRLPVVIDLVDSAEAIRRILPEVDRLLPHGTLTLTPVRFTALRTRSGK